MSIRNDGHLGERACINSYHAQGYKAFQIDAIIFNKEGTPAFIEAKVKNSKFRINIGFQDEFIGHGLNLSQAFTRLCIQKLTGIRVIFWVLDTEEKCIYYKYLDELLSLDDMLVTTNYKRTSNYFMTRNNIIVFDINQLDKKLCTPEEYDQMIRRWGKELVCEHCSNPDNIRVFISGKEVIVPNYCPMCGETIRGE